MLLADLADPVTDMGAGCYSLEMEGHSGGSGTTKPLRSDSAGEVCWHFLLVWASRGNEKACKQVSGSLFVSIKCL